MRFLITNTRPSTSPFTADVVKEAKIGIWSLFSTEEGNFDDTNEFVVIIEGYVKDLQSNHNNLTEQKSEVFKELWNSWPLAPNITGSFSAAMINKDSSELILCNDLIGVYPLYYLKSGKDLYVSNSLIWLGAISGSEFDETGIAQRCFGPEFSNLGSRTILKGCKRLLPGEWLKYNVNADQPEKKYDNSLYQEIDEKANEKSLQTEFWNTLTKELKSCLNTDKQVNLALSGGIDSRLLLGAIPTEKKISCYTYGKEENYETKIARALAEKKGADFNSYSQPWLYFPDKALLHKYTLDTEALYLCSWLEILENVKKDNREVFLLGDLSTAISGRTIRKFSTKEYREKNFFKHSVLSKEFELEPNTPKTIESWKNHILNKFTSPLNKKSLEKLNLEKSVEEIRENTRADISELFERIDRHNLKYIDLVDELFTWYTHTRLSMGKQILINNSKFRAYCPGLSISVIRKASNIPPNLRLNQKFVRKLFKEVKELRALGRIPTSQIPLIPQNSSDLIRFPVWGIRSKLDDFLIKRMMKARDPKMRYRLFPSNNWVEVYQNPDMEKNLNEYFANNHLGKNYVENIKAQAKNRRDLKQWPFANMNIINAAALNAELDLIVSFRKQDEV
ncbi:MAG: asparagine synthase-related protein [Bacteroidota bacterium]